MVVVFPIQHTMLLVTFGDFKAISYDGVTSFILLIAPILKSGFLIVFIELNI